MCTNLTQKKPCKICTKHAEIENNKYKLKYDQHCYLALPIYIYQDGFEPSFLVYLN